MMPPKMFLVLHPIPTLVRSLSLLKIPPVGCRLPGPGCLWMGQTLRFLKPVRVGERVKANAEVVEVLHNKQRVRLRTTCQVGSRVVIDGEALVWVPLREDEVTGVRR